MKITTGIILAGGKSIRLGKEKALIQFKGKSLIERVVSRLHPIVNELIIVTNEEKHQNFSSLDLNSKVVSDIYPNRAALGGIYTGLKYSNFDYSVVVACDMPFLNPELLNYMINIASGYNAIVPKIGWFVEPLHAVYSRNCMETAEYLIKNNILTVRDLIKRINTRYITEKEMSKFDPDIISFFNINSKEDLKKAEQITNKLNGD